MRLIGLNAVVLLLVPSACTAAPTVVSVLTRNGEKLEGEARFTRLTFEIRGNTRSEPLDRVLSVHTAAPASARETDRIGVSLLALGGRDVPARDQAIAELTEIGLPALSPVLQSFKDRDLRQPDPLYRMFSRIIPGEADLPDRSLDLIRLRDRDPVRGKLRGPDLRVRTSDGREQTVPVSEIRRIAVRQREVRKTVQVHSLLHSTQIEFLDSGIAMTRESTLNAQADGYVRLDFDRDGWSSDPDGLKKPGPNYSTNLVDGFPFGALVGRIDATGPRWFVGRRLQKSAFQPGRLYLAVNDNPHWQNNVGSFRVILRATDAYDLGEAQ